jgi:sulfonate transport system substrate-binding protein
MFQLKKTKLISLFLIIILVLTACSPKNTSTTSGTSTEVKEENDSSDAVTDETTAQTETTASQEIASTTATADSDIDLSGVTLRFGATGWELQKALLEAAGLADTEYKVEYSTFQGGNLCLEAMASNQIDLCGSSEIPPVFASLAENGGNFKIVAISNSNTQDQEVVIPKGSAIKTVADLKGKKVGYIKSTTAQYFLYQMLKAAGLSWNDIDAVEITTADGVTALLGGELDAFASYGNSINAAKNNGATTLASAEDILSGNFPFEASVTALADESKKAAIVDYLARIQLAYEWQKSHLDDWAKISADPTGQTAEQTLETLKKGYAQRDTSIQIITEAAIQSEQSIADTFLEIGLLEKQVDVTNLYDDSLSDDITAAIENLRK